jgi:predicted secreted Zn-dependent protease
VVGALLLAAPAWAVRVHDRVVYYDLTGKTQAELREQMQRLGPTGEDGQRYDGYTEWNVTWRHRFQPQGRGCGLAEFDVDVDVLMTLPRWQDRTGTDDELVRSWERYERGLRTHEEGHRDNGVKTAERIEQLLKTLPPATFVQAPRGADRDRIRGHPAGGLGPRPRIRRHHRSRPERGRGLPVGAGAQLATDTATWRPPAVNTRG